MANFCYDPPPCSSPAFYNLFLHNWRVLLYTMRRETWVTWATFLPLHFYTYGFPIDTSSFVIAIIYSWKTAQLCFVLWERFQAVLIISGLTKITVKNSCNNILWCAAIHAQQTHESYGTVTFEPLDSKYHQGNKKKC